MYLKHDMQNQKFSELYTDDKKTKYSNYILKSAKSFYEKLYTKNQPLKLSLVNFLAKFLTERKFKMNKFIFARLKLLFNFINIFSDENSTTHLNITFKN